MTLIFAVFFYLNVKTIEVSGISMETTLHNHQRVLVSKAYWLIGKIQDGDIVVMPDPHGPGYIIKRVFKSAGEDVDFDWRPVNSPGPGYRYVVPAGSVYVLGDNREWSEDSRKFGFVDMSTIIGKVLHFERADKGK